MNLSVRLMVVVHYGFGAFMLWRAEENWPLSMSVLFFVIGFTWALEGIARDIR